MTNNNTVDSVIEKLKKEKKKRYKSYTSSEKEGRRLSFNQGINRAIKIVNEKMHKTIKAVLKYVSLEEKKVKWPKDDPFGYDIQFLRGYNQAEVDQKKKHNKVLKGGE